MVNEMVNYYIKTYLDSTLEINKNGLDISVVILKKISTEFFENRVLLQLPLSVAIRKPGLFKGIQAKGQMRLTLDINYELSKDWQLTTQTELRELIWISKPNLGTAVIKLPLNWLTELLSSRIESKIVNSIDNSILDHINIQKILIQIIEISQTGFSQNKLINHYLNLHIGSVGLNPLKLHSGNLQHIFCARGRIDLTEDFMKDRYVLALPEIESDISDNLESQLFINARLKDSLLEAWLNEILYDEELVFRKYRFTFEHLNLKLSSETIFIEVNFAGDFKGLLGISFNPEYFSNEKMIKAKDLNISMNTRNLILKSLFILAKPIIKHQFRNLLKSDLNKMNNYVQEKVNAMISVQAKEYGVRNSMLLKEVILNKFELNTNLIHATIYTRMEINAELKNYKLLLNKILT